MSLGKITTNYNERKVWKIEFKCFTCSYISVSISNMQGAHKFFHQHLISVNESAYMAKRTHRFC